MFPFLPKYLQHTTSYSQLLRHLPSYARVTALTENYINNLSWFLLPVDRAQIKEELIPTFYPSFKPMLPTSEDFTKDMLPTLAVMFAVFACGSAGDWTQDLINSEAEMFERLARCALGMHDIFNDSSIECIQTLLLLSIYEMLTFRKFDKESDWRLTAFALTAASSVSILHLVYVVSILT